MCKLFYMQKETHYYCKLLKWSFYWKHYNEMYVNNLKLHHQKVKPRGFFFIHYYLINEFWVISVLVTSADAIICNDSNELEFNKWAIDAVDVFHPQNRNNLFVRVQELCPFEWFLEVYCLLNPPNRNKPFEISSFHCSGYPSNEKEYISIHSIFYWNSFYLL